MPGVNLIISKPDSGGRALTSSFQGPVISAKANFVQTSPLALSIDVTRTKIEPPSQLLTSTIREPVVLGVTLVEVPDALSLTVSAYDATFKLCSNLYIDECTLTVAKVEPDVHGSDEVFEVDDIHTYVTVIEPTSVNTEVDINEYTPEYLYIHNHLSLTVNEPTISIGTSSINSIDAPADPDREMTVTFIDPATTSNVTIKPYVFSLKVKTKEPLLSTNVPVIYPDVLELTLETYLPTTKGVLPDSIRTIIVRVNEPLKLTVTQISNRFATSDDYPATIAADIGTLLSQRAGYLNSDGHLDSIKKIQDSYYYQQFSYVLKTAESVDIYKKAVLDFIHPAGMLMFGSFSPVYVINDSGFQNSYNLFIWRWQNNFDLDIQVEPQTRLVVTLQQNSSSYKLGPSLKSIERDKFYYNPSSLTDYSTSVSAEQVAWYQSLGLDIDGEAVSNPIENFYQYITQQFADTPWLKVNYSTEPIIHQTSKNNLVRLGAVKFKMQPQRRIQTFDATTYNVVVLKAKRINVSGLDVGIADYNTDTVASNLNYLDPISNVNCAMWLSPRFVLTDAGAGYPYINRAKTSGRLSAESVGFDFAPRTLDSNESPIITRSDSSETLSLDSGDLGSANWSETYATYSKGKLTEDNTAGVSHYITSNPQSLQVLEDVMYKIRARVKYGNRNASLNFSSGAWSETAHFNLLVGDVESITSGIYDAKVVRDGDYLIISARSTATVTGTADISVQLSNPTGTTTYDGDLTGYIWLDWIQFQTGDADDVYLPTTTVEKRHGVNGNPMFYFHGNTDSNLCQLKGDLTDIETDSTDNTFTNLLGGKTDFTMFGSFLPENLDSQTIFSISDQMNLPKILTTTSFSGEISGGQFVVSLRSDYGGPGGTLSTVSDYIHSGINYFVIMKYGLNLKIQVNNRSWVSTTLPGDLHSHVTDYNLQFGRNVNGSNHFVGKLGDFVIYNRSLNPDENITILKLLRSLYGPVDNVSNISRLITSSVTISPAISATHQSDIVCNLPSSVIRLFPRRTSNVSVLPSEFEATEVSVTFAINEPVIFAHPIIITPDVIEATVSTDNTHEIVGQPTYFAEQSELNITINEPVITT